MNFSVNCYHLLWLYVGYYPTPLWNGQDVIQGQFLSRVHLVWIQSFLSIGLVALTRLQSALLFTRSWGEEMNIDFPRALAKSETQLAPSMIWTQVVDTY